MSTANRFKTMDGQTFDVGSRVEWWLNDRVKVWTAMVVGWDHGSALVSIDGCTVYVTPEDAMKHIRLYALPPHDEPIPPEDVFGADATREIDGGRGLVIYSQMAHNAVVQTMNRLFDDSASLNVDDMRDLADRLYKLLTDGVVLLEASEVGKWFDSED